MIYLDHNATTPIAPEVLEAMMPYLTSEWGNPSSSYKFGSKLKAVIETARAQVAELIGAQSREIVFTSCATESSNAAIRAALAANPGKRHIITSAVEHSSVLNLCKALEVGTAGLHRASSRCPAVRYSETTSARSASTPYHVTYLPVDRDGLLKLADLESAITDETAVVSLMWANNETGVLFPVKEIAEICRTRRVLFHCDAVQAAGKIEVDVRKVPMDYLSLAGHKFHAPKGVGALYVHRKAPFSPLIYGGHQEASWPTELETSLSVNVLVAVVAEPTNHYSGCVVRQFTKFVKIIFPGEGTTSFANVREIGFPHCLAESFFQQAAAL